MGYGRVTHSLLLYILYIIYHEKSRLNTPVWDSLRSPNHIIISISTLSRCALLTLVKGRQCAGADTRLHAHENGGKLDFITCTAASSGCNLQLESVVGSMDLKRRGSIYRRICSPSVECNAVRLYQSFYKAWYFYPCCVLALGNILYGQ